MWTELISDFNTGKVRAIARMLSLVENQHEGYEAALATLEIRSVPVIGITGPPGAGKSTLTDALIAQFLSDEKRIAVLCVDPSSAYSRGALLGDRVRMGRWYNESAVFIRSVASRGALGGLNPSILEMLDVLKAADFDHIIVETVGIGQSEIDIAALADATVVVLVPEGGDEVQAMKAGMMEIADIFAVNKSDRPGADLFVKNLRQMIMPSTAHGVMPLVQKVIATQNEGVEKLQKSILKVISQNVHGKKSDRAFAEKAWYLLQQKQMKKFDKGEMLDQLGTALKLPGFNLYAWIEAYNG